MRKTVLMTALFAAAAIAASLAETGPIGPQPVPWQYLWDGLQPMDQGQCDAPCFIQSSSEPNYALLTGDGVANPDEPDDRGWREPTRDWGNDILIGAPEYNIVGRISVDNDVTTGDIYVCMYNRDATVNDTAHVWRSTDGGRTWNSLTPVIGTAGMGNLVDAQLLVGTGPGDTTWFYLFSASDTSGLRVRRMTPDQTRFNWVTISPETSIVRVSVDRNIENPQHLFVAWTERDGDIRMMSSTNGGMTWANAYYVASGRRAASMAAGGDGYLYLAYLDDTDSTYYRAARITNNLIQPSATFATVDSNTVHRFREVAIAADRTAPGTSQAAIILNTVRYTTNNNVAPRYAWTTTGGTAWSAGVWPVTNQPRSTWWALFPRIRRSYDSELFRAIVSMRETTTTWDTIVYAYARGSNPTNWLDRGTYNDHRNTGEVSHDVGQSNRSGGGFFAYRQYGRPEVWFDGYSLTGVSSSLPTHSNRSTTATFSDHVSLTLPIRANVSATLYYQDGRLAQELYNGLLEAGAHRLKLPAGLAPGIYFLRAEVNGRTELTKVVHIR